MANIIKVSSLPSASSFLNIGLSTDLSFSALLMTGFLFPKPADKVKPKLKVLPFVKAP